MLHIIGLSYSSKILIAKLVAKQGRFLRNDLSLFEISAKICAISVKWYLAIYFELLALRTSHYQKTFFPLLTKLEVAFTSSLLRL